MSEQSIKALVYFFAMAIAITAVVLFWNVVTNDTGINAALWNQNSFTQSVKNSGDAFNSRLDMYMLMGYLALHLGIIVMAFFGRVHPVFYIIGIVVTLLLVIISPYFSNAFNDIMANSAFTAAAAQMPKTNLIMDHLPLWEFLWATATSIIMYGLSKYGE